MTTYLRAYTPETLAARWDCSARHIRNMIRDGDLSYFRVGGKLLRIQSKDVEDYECRNIDLDDTEDSSPPSAEPEPTVNVVRLERIALSLSE